MSEYLKEIVLILIGLFVGWLLKEISEGRKSWAVRKKAISHSLACILTIHHGLKTINRGMEAAKKSDISWVDYEMMRQRIMKKFESSLDDIQAELEKSRRTYLDYFPFESSKIDLAYNTMNSIRKTNLSATVKKDEELYVNMLSTHEVTLETLTKLIEKQIFFLARRHSNLNFVRALYYLYKSRKAPSELMEKNSEFFGDYTSKIFARLDKFK